MTQAGITEIKRAIEHTERRKNRPMKTESTKSWRRLTFSSKVCVHSKHWKHGPSNRLACEHGELVDWMKMTGSIAINCE